MTLNNNPFPPPVTGQPLMLVFYLLPLSLLISLAPCFRPFLHVLCSLFHFLLIRAFPFFFIHPSSTPPTTSPSFLSVFCLVCFLKLHHRLPRLPFSPSYLSSPLHHVRPLISPVSCLLNHQRSQRAAEPPADSTHNSPLLIMRTTGARGAQFKH